MMFGVLQTKLRSGPYDFKQPTELMILAEQNCVVTKQIQFLT